MVSKWAYSMMVEKVKTELRDYSFSCKREAEK